MADAKVSKKFSLIIIVVAIVITFIVPLRQVKETRSIVMDLVNNFELILQAENDFKANPELGDGSYAMDIMQLDPNILSKVDTTYFSYAVTDTTINAVSKKTFGIEGASIFYYLPAGPYSVGDDELSRKAIDPNWLP